MTETQPTGHKSSKESSPISVQNYPFPMFYLPWAGQPASK